MSVFRFAVHKTLETLQIYWELVRIMVPVTIVTEVMSRTGLIDLAAPALAPIMGLFGLPPELGLAWLTGMLVGIWGAIAMIFTLVPAESMSVADITVFSSLVLIAHGLPIEQKIIQKAGPGFSVTTMIRIIGAVVYAMILHHLFTATGWQAETLNPTWIPVAAATDWMGFLAGLIEALIYMLAILLVLSWTLEILKLIGLMALLMKILAPTLRLAGIRGETGQFTAVGLFLGISYGGGLLIREARSGNLPPRQVFISCVFMGFAHSIIEDTLLVMALGADVFGVLIGRLIFAIAATALIAHLIRSIPDETFFAWVFQRRRSQSLQTENRSAVPKALTSDMIEGKEHKALGRWRSAMSASVPRHQGPYCSGPRAWYVSFTAPAGIGSNWSDGVDGSTRTASHCAMLVLCESQQRKEPTTWRLQHSGSIWPSPSFSCMALMEMGPLSCRRSCGEPRC